MHRRPKGLKMPSGRGLDSYLRVVPKRALGPPSGFGLGNLERFMNLCKINWARLILMDPLEGPRGCCLEKYPGNYDSWTYTNFRAPHNNSSHFALG